MGYHAHDCAVCCIQPISLDQIVKQYDQPSAIARAEEQYANRLTYVLKAHGHVLPGHVVELVCDVKQDYIGNDCAN